MNPDRARAALAAALLCAWGCLAASAQGTGTPAVAPPPAVTLDLSVASALEGAGLYFEGTATSDGEGRIDYEQATSAIHAKALALLGLAESPEIHQALSDTLRVVSEDLQDNGVLRVRALLSLSDAAALQAAHRAPTGLPLLDDGPTAPPGGATQPSDGGLAEITDAELQAALQERPNDPDLLTQLGLRYAASGRTAEALAAFQRAADLLGGDPKSAVARCNIAAIYFGQSRIGDALKQYRLAVQADPNSALGHFGSGACYEALGEAGRARAEYSATLVLATEGPLAEAAKAAIARIGTQAPAAPGGGAPGAGGGR